MVSKWENRFRREGLAGLEERRRSGRPPQVEDTTKVTYGNLLTLPVGTNGLLYVQPMYTESRSNSAAVPKLYRILVYYQAQVGYAPTVAEALSQVGINPTRFTADLSSATARNAPSTVAAVVAPASWRPSASSRLTIAVRSPGQVNSFRLAAA